MNIINRENVELTTTQEDQLNRLNSLGVFNDYTFIRINRLEDAVEENSISVDIDSLDCKKILFKGEKVDFIEESEYTWVGYLESVDSCDCSDGELLLISKNGKKYGRLNVNENSYIIRDLGENLNVLFDIDNEMLSRRGYGDDSGGHLQTTESISSTRSDTHCPIRALILFTQAAQVAIGDIDQTIQTALLQTNIAYHNSKVSNVSMSLAGSQLLPNTIFLESGNLVADVEGLKNNTFINNLRDNVFFADIVVVITNGGYGDLGRVDAIGPNKNEAYAIVEVAEATGQGLVFSHETGHLIGGRHEDDSIGPFEHAHVLSKWCSPWERMTIMHSTEIVNIIPHYSNPNVTFDGKKTGKKERDNARKIRNDGCEVSEFRNGNELHLYASIISENDKEYEVKSVCPCNITQLTSWVYGGSSGSYQFEWRTSTDGINYSEVQGISQSFGLGTWDFCEPGDGEWCFEACLNLNIFVRLTVKSSDGQVVNVTRHFITDDIWSEQEEGEFCNNEFEGLIMSNNNENNHKFQVMVYPNHRKERQI